MISFSSKLPVLQIGSHQLKNYETSWILRAINTALESADAGNSFVAENIYEGVMYSLQNDCPWVPLKIEELYEKIEYLFGKIGFEHAKEGIPRYCPSVRISVLDELTQLDCQLEMVLLQNLQNELEALAAYGVEEVILDDVIETVNHMMPGKKWNKHCQLLHDEITSLEVGYNTSRARYGVPTLETLRA